MPNVYRSRNIPIIHGLKLTVLFLFVCCARWGAGLLPVGTARLKALKPDRMECPNVLG